MQIFLATFLIVSLAVIGMAAGVLISNKRLKGSCGGLNAVGIDKTCGCENPCDKKKKRLANEAQRIEFQR